MTNTPGSSSPFKSYRISYSNLSGMIKPLCVISRLLADGQRFDSASALLSCCSKAVVHGHRLILTLFLYDEQNIKMTHLAAHLLSCPDSFLEQPDLTPMFHSLHWLPTEQRIEYKLSLLRFKIISHRAPMYLSELCPCP